MFFVPALNLAGIPPFSGFIGKVGLLEAGAQDGSALAWVLVGGSVVTSLLTLYVVARVWTKAFWRAREDAPEVTWPLRAVGTARRAGGHQVRRSRRGGPHAVRDGGADGAVIIVGLTLTILAGPIFAYSEGGRRRARPRPVLAVAHR